MDERYEETEEEPVTKQREASLAGVLAGLFILFLFGILVIAAFAFLPDINLASPPQPPMSLPEASW